MMDIRLLIRGRQDKVFTKAGDRVEIVGVNLGVHHSLIYGNVLRGEKKIPHYWQPDGRFKNFKDSELDLIVKI